MEVNPFIALQDNLRFALARHMLPTQSIQLYILSVLLAISLIISLVALGFRIKNKTFWLFRNVDGFILPAGSNCWLIASIIFGFIGQMYILQPEVRSDTVTLIIITDCLVWLPLWLGRWIMTWATAYAALSVIYPRVKESRKIILIFNFFFIIFPFLALIPIIIFAVSAQKYAKQGYQLFDILDAALTVAIDQVNEGTYVDTPAIGFLFKQLAAQFDLSAYWLQKAWIDWAVATGIEFLVFVAVSIIYLGSIFKSISVVRQQQSSTKGSTGAGKLSSLSTALQGLIFSSVLSIFVSTAHFGTVVYLSTGGPGTEYCVLIVIWTYVISGAAAGSVAILLRSFDSPTNSQISSVKSPSKASFFTSNNSRKRIEVVYEVELDRVEDEESHAMGNLGKHAV